MEGVCLSVCLSFDYLVNRSSDWVYCWGPNELQCQVWSCLDEWFSRKLQAATPEATQSARSKQERFWTGISYVKYRVPLHIWKVWKMKVIILRSYCELLEWNGGKVLFLSLYIQIRVHILHIYSHRHFLKNSICKWNKERNTELKNLSCSWPSKNGHYVFAQCTQHTICCIVSYHIAADIWCDFFSIKFLFWMSQTYVFIYMLDCPENYFSLSLSELHLCFYCKKET